MAQFSTFRQWSTLDVEQTIILEFIIIRILWQNKTFEHFKYVLMRNKKTPDLKWTVSLRFDGIVKKKYRRGFFTVKISSPVSSSCRHFTGFFFSIPNVQIYDYFFGFSWNRKKIEIFSKRRNAPVAVRR